VEAIMRVLLSICFLGLLIAKPVEAYTEALFKQKILASLHQTPVVFNKLLDPCTAVDVSVVILNAQDKDVQQKNDKGIKDVVAYLEKENRDLKPLPPEIAKKVSKTCKW
jgi:hypothetical protein